MSAADRDIIPAGVRIHLIKSHRGSYIRTPDGKFYAIRQSSTTVNKPVSAPPPPRPLPPPSQPSSSLLDELLFGMIIKK